VRESLNAFVPGADEAVVARFLRLLRYVDGDYNLRPTFDALRATLGGEEVRRSYSICSGLDDGELRIAVKRVAEVGVTLVEYTDVARDGLLVGVDAQGAARLAREAGVEVVASGGVASLDDVRACTAAGLFGVIVGKALYERRIDLAEAIRIARE